VGETARSALAQTAKAARGGPEAWARSAGPEPAAQRVESGASGIGSVGEGCVGGTGSGAPGEPGGCPGLGHAVLHI
jgi:hypothetical protein